MHRQSALIVCCLAVACIARGVRADENAPVKSTTAPHAAALAALLEPIRAKHDVPGITGAIVTSKGLVALGASGVRRQGAEAQVTTDDLWHIGSCTKSMTATLIGRLVEKGKLHWDTTLGQAFPKLAMHADWRPVTLAQLLRNRGGAPHGLQRDGLLVRLAVHKGSAQAARRMLLLGVLKHKPAYEPETKYVYSNAGFTIAGHVAETVMQKPYEELIVEELFRPLGMRHAGFGAPGDARKLDQPQGHRTVDGKRVPMPPGPGADNPAAISPAGRVHLTMRDWARYIALHLAGARDGKERLLLDRVTLRQIQDGKAGQSYALGWTKAQRPWGGGPVLTHNGSNTLWFAVAWLAPKKDFAVIVACNVGGTSGTQACDGAAWALIQWQLAQKAKAR